MTSNVETTIILASQSPRRAQLLRDAGYTFEVITPSFREPDRFGDDVPPYAQAEALSYFKARSVLQEGIKGIIIGADTIVAAKNQIFGKPVDREDAKRKLQSLIGTSHEVITGLTVICTRDDQRVIGHDSTTVTMNPVDDKTLEQYLDTGLWEGKAGAYGLQDGEDPFIESINGSFSNVVGLPMELLEAQLERLACDPDPLSHEAP